MTPVAQKGAQNHQAVLHAADDLCCAVSSEQQLSTVLKTAKSEGLVVPLGDHQLQLLLNISFFHCTDTDILQKKYTYLKEDKIKCWPSSPFEITSISSLYLSKGASIILRSLNVSVSTSKLCPVTLTQNQMKWVNSIQTLSQQI